jgi:hypothetical protein
VGQVKDGFDVAYRDFKVSGVPASGPNEPSKADIRALGRTVDINIAAAAAAVSGDGITAILGAVQPVVNDALAQIDTATQEAVSDALDAARPIIAASTTLAANAASLATGQAVRADDAADRAELARDAALLNGDLFLTVAAGLAATPAGQRFAVAGSPGSGIYATSWLNQSGTAVAPLSYPSLDAYNQVRADTDVVRLASNVEEHVGPLNNQQRGLSLRKIGAVLTPDAAKPFMAGWVESPSIWEDPWCSRAILRRITTPRRRRSG